jgi:spore coat polysaccharide biosynthesis predicted glycosyltransferase SpsG
MDEVLSRVKRLSDAKAADGRTLKEALAYDGVSLWWFVEHSVYLKLKKAGGRKITERKFIIDAICILTKMFILTKFLFRGIIGRLNKVTPDFSNRRKILFFGSLQHWRTVRDPTTLESGKGDVILENMIKALKRENFDVLCLSRDDSHLIDIKRFVDQLANGKGEWKAIETYLTFDVINTAFKEAKRLENAWNDFLKQLPSEDKKRYGSLAGDFKIFFVYHTFNALLYMGLSERVIDKEKPKLVVLDVEHGDSGRSMTAIGRLNGTPTLSIQHGFYTRDSIMYYNEKKEVSNTISSQCNPLPDKTAVYGPWIKNVFVKEFNYPGNSIVVTGQPRYDILEEAGKIYSKERFCEKFGIDPHKKIILIITQPLSPEKREAFLRNVLRGLMNINNIEIVIKPHPVENDNWHKKISNEENVKAVVLPNSSDTFEALCACDAMITVSSTTALEAAILGKEVIIANLVKSPISYPLAEGGAALSVKRAEELSEAVKKALYDKKTKVKLKKGRKTFVYQHTYKQDGKSTERVVGLIKMMLAGKEII